MTAVIPGSSSIFFDTRESIIDRLLQNTLNNTGRMVGTEVEVFFTNEDNNPITTANGQKAFLFLKESLSQKYKVEPVYEMVSGDQRDIVSLTS